MIEVPVRFQLIVLSGPASGSKLPLRLGENVVGRDDWVDVPVVSTLVSRRHAVVRVRPGGKIVIRDLASRNGTRVNGVRVFEEADVAVGDTVELGDVKLRLTEIDRATPVGGLPGAHGGAEGGPAGATLPGPALPGGTPSGSAPSGHAVAGATRAGAAPDPVTPASSRPSFPWPPATEPPPWRSSAAPAPAPGRHTGDPQAKVRHDAPTGFLPRIPAAPGPGEAGAVPPAQALASTRPAPGAALGRAAGPESGTAPSGAPPGTAWRSQPDVAPSRGDAPFPGPAAPQSGRRTPGRSSRDPLFLWVGVVAAVVALLLLVFAWPDQFVTRVLLLLVAGAGVMAVVRGVRGVREPSRGRRPAV